MANNISLGTKITGVAAYNIPEIPGYIAEPQKQYHLIFDKYGIDGSYYIFNVEPDKIGDFVKAAVTLRMPGFGVTMPHKSAIVPYIDHLDEDAKKCNAVNLVVIRDGETYGYMTDGTGYCYEWDTRGINLSGRKVTILGAGAITPIICYELAKRNVDQFTLLNRTLDRAEKTANIIRNVTGKEVKIMELTNENLYKIAPETQLMIQCTPRGMDEEYPDWEDLGFIDLLPEGCLVSDVIPIVEETKFLAYAKSKGHETTNGIDMEVHQMPETFARCFPDMEFGNDLVEISRKAYGHRA